MHKNDHYLIISMLETIEKIERYTAKYRTAEDLYANDRDFDATMMNFIVLGEVCGKLSEDIKTNNLQIDWTKIYGLRNIIAHQYFGINVDIVWQIINNDLPTLKNDLRNMVY
jgi:uncharacterized protein with HEPN domain